jgi:glycerol kinase
VGIWKDLEEIEERWRVDREALPDPAAADKARAMRRDWKRAVERSLGWAPEEEACT